MDNIKDFARSSEKRKVHIPFTFEELQTLRKEFVASNVDLSKAQDELAELTKAHRENIKRMKEVCREQLSQIMNEGVEKEVTCYLMDNQETGKMEYYTEDGLLVHQRPLYPEERQLHMISSQHNTTKDGTNG